MNQVMNQVKATPLKKTPSDIRTKSQPSSKQESQSKFQQKVTFQFNLLDTDMKIPY
jgi:hypothetical protein